MPRTPCIHVIGSINRDIVVFVDRHPVPGETMIGRRWSTFPGGKGANQAVAAARLNCPVHMIGRIGTDAFGHDMRAFLQSEGINISAIQTVSNAATGIALITVDAKSENSIIVVPGANRIWDAAPKIDAEPGDIVIAQLEIPLSIVTTTFQTSKIAGATTVLNPSPHEPLPKALLAATDIIVLNEIELGQMAGRGVDLARPDAIIAAARLLISFGPTTIVVTLGARGAIVVTQEDATTIPAHSVKPVDTTGAGDCFTGALAAGLLAGNSIQFAATRASRAAALSVTREGAAASFPTSTDLELN
jgi:ribokinase